MTVREYNNWYKSYNDAYSFVNNIDHAIEKAGCSANHQIQCIGWSEDVKQTLIDALETLKNQKRQMTVSEINKKRMIDIDELREELGVAEQCENCKQDEWNCQRDCYYSLRDFCAKLDIAIETILERHKDNYGCIVEYDKNGYWINPTSQDCHCSECGEQPVHEPGESVPLYDFCPYCGAKMEVKWNE